MFVSIGRLTLDAEVKTVDVNGEEKRVYNNRLAIRISRDETAFIEIVAWGGTAEFIGSHFCKGDELYIEGEIRNRTYKGETREMSYPYALVSRVRFTHGKKSDNYV